MNHWRYLLADNLRECASLYNRLATLDLPSPKLLDLFAARLERQPVSVSSLCIAAAVPATTALRWIKTMTDAGLFLREADPRDGRRIFIALTESVCEAMARYFEALDD